ncbi:hypothetical protein BDV28DRAFT_140794 [Aspergillus coremiiformis]|uniref:MYND-type domain-containing protein n=1 Tax=Aspergillus coremiiformis TaxID=138285 RepID=A0A5N6YYC2_9EURO|nr:hypothetical protein BDV28DRAFT_140794 [Aspergillus coremiiformis]
MGNQSDVAVCSSLSCQKPGKHHCSGCRTAAYCSPTCQKSHWKVHKKTCAGAKKYNCFIIRATPIDPTKENPTDADYIEPFPLDSYGNWGAEMDELKKKRQWGGVLEPGKLYSHRPVNRWHYHAYQQYEKTDPPINPVASRCYRREINGDVAVVRSSQSITKLVAPVRPTSGRELP